MRPSARLDRNARTENALCERGIGYVLQCYHLAGNRRRYLDAAVAAKQIFQFTKHFAHNLFD